MHVRSWQAAYGGLLPDEYLDGLRPEDRAGRYTSGDLRPDRPATIVAVERGIIRGFATIGPSRDADRQGAGSCTTSTSTPTAGVSASAAL
jgi:hypothetical protein